MTIIGGLSANANGQYGQAAFGAWIDYAVGTNHASFGLTGCGIQAINFSQYGLYGYAIVQVDGIRVSPWYELTGVITGNAPTSWAWVVQAGSQPWVEIPKTAASQKVELVARVRGQVVNGYGAYSGDSGISVLGSFTLPALEKPSALAGLSITGSCTNSHTLSWTANTGVRTDGYRVYQKINGGSETLVSTVTDTTVTLASRTAGVAYTYRVAPYNVSGEGLTQAGTVYGAVIAPTIALKTYTAPSTAVFTVGNTNTFDASRVVERSVDSGSSWTTVATATSVNANSTLDVSLASQPAGTALYRTKFTSPAETAYSSNSSVTFMDVPSVPTSVGLTLSGNVFTGSWAAVTSGNNAAATVTYEFVNSGGSIVASDTVAATSTSATYTGGTDTALKLRVKSNNARGSSAYSAYTALVYNTLATPTIVVSSYTAPKTVALSVTNNSVSAGTFAVEKSSNGSSGWTVLASQSINSGASKTFTDTDAYTPNSFYRARATAPNTSAYTNPVSQQTITAPNAPSNVTIARTLGTTTTLTASWTLDATAVKPIDKVEWEWLNGGTVTNSDFGVTSTSTSLTIDLNTGRSIRVRTSNSAGSSAWVTSSVATGFVTAPNFTDVSLLTSSGLPVTFSATANTALNGYIMKVQFCTSDGTVMATLLNELASGAKLVTFPYFNASNKLDIGNYKFTAVLCEPDGTVISTVTSSTALTRGNITAPESFSANSTGITVSNAAPYSAQRVISFSVKPYKASQTALTGSVTQPKAQSNSSASYNFVGRALKAPIVLWSATVTGKYDDGSTAWSKTESGVITKGQALYVGNDVVMPHVITSDGIIEVFPEVII